MAVNPGAPDPFGKLLDEAKRNYKLAEEAQRDIRQESLDDFRFYAGQQWPEQIEADRRNSGRPCLTINRLRQFAKQILNQQRQSRPSIQVNPKGDGATVEEAEVIQGLCRHIELQSGADIAYDTACEHAVIGGFGYIRLRTAYAHDRTFDQEIYIDRVLDAFSVYFDPSAVKPDYSDAEYCFVVEEMATEAYRRKYPNSKVASLNEFGSVRNPSRSWFQNGCVRLVEYFRVVKKKRVLVLLTNGATVFEEDIPSSATIETKDGRPAMRTVEIPTVEYYKLNAEEVLEQSTWPGPSIPIIPVLGDELIVDGKRKLFGLIRDMKDPQRQYNYTRSGAVETAALAPRNQWVAAEGQIEGHEEEYRASNTRSQAVMFYKPMSVEGVMVPPPARQAIEPAVQAWVELMTNADNDLKATSGLYDASLGVRGPEQSGKAIMARKAQGDIANFNFMDNLSRAIEAVGRQIVAMRSTIYDTAREQRIVNPDGTHRLVEINQPTKDKGEEKYFDMSVGRYDVSISVGPSYQSKRQEFVESVLQLVSAVPQVAQFILDLVVRSMDWPGAEEIADRLKKMLPPQLQDGEQEEGKPQISPEAQQQIAELLQQQASIVAQLQAATSLLATKRLELESNERMNAMKVWGQVTAAELKAQSSGAQQAAQMQFDAITKRLDLLHEGMSVDQEIQQEAAKQAAEHAHEQQQQAADQQHQQQMQQGQQQHDQQMAAQQQQAQAEQTQQKPQPAAA